MDSLVAYGSWIKERSMTVITRWNCFRSPDQSEKVCKDFFNAWHKEVIGWQIGALWGLEPLTPTRRAMQWRLLEDVWDNLLIQVVKRPEVMNIWLFTGRGKASCIGQAITVFSVVAMKLRWLWRWKYWESSRICIWGIEDLSSPKEWRDHLVQL